MSLYNNLCKIHKENTGTDYIPYSLLRLSDDAERYAEWLRGTVESRQIAAVLYSLWWNQGENDAAN